MSQSPHNFYVVTCSAATRVSASCVAHFVTPDERNLLVAKGSSIEIYRMGEEVLLQALKVPINGVGGFSLLSLFFPFSSCCSASVRERS